MSPQPIRVLELRSVRGTGGGPEKTILLGAGLADRTAFDITVCYLRDARDGVFAIDAQAQALGVSYVEITERHSFDFSIWHALRQLVRTRRIDIIHAHEYKTDLLAWLVARSARAIPLATVHGWTGNSTREQRLYYPLDKRLLRRFPQLIAVSSQIRDELIRTGSRPERVTTILNGVDPQAFRRVPSDRAQIRAEHGVAPGDVVIGSVGRLESQKRFDVLIKSFARLKERMPKLRLMIVGEGSARSSMTALLDRLGVRRSCDLLGHRTDVAALHHAFDVFVQSSDYEGTPNAVLEAMALETAVVATNVGGTAELVRDGIDGLIVPPGDVDSLTAAIERALTEPSQTARYVANARARIETDLSFETRTRKLEGIYRALAENRARSGARTRGAEA